MKIVVLAGGLSTERDVSFKTGDMVSKALRENGHQVILLDVFMGYSDKREDVTDIFEKSEEASIKVSDIPEIAPDIAKVKASISGITFVRKNSAAKRPKATPAVSSLSIASTVNLRPLS